MKIMYEKYSLLFVDSFLANFVISANEEVILHAMLIFGNYHNYIIMLMVMLASSAAFAINYLLGIISNNMLIKYANASNLAKKRIDDFKQSYLLLALLCLSPIPLIGKFAIFFAGFARASFWVCFLIALAAKLVYYLAMNNNLIFYG